jgi:mRNA-degrading endonuclease RelE of RelBE toxin-antitoxin system
MNVIPKKYVINIKKSVQKNLKKLPQDVVQRFNALAEDLREKGPVAHGWKNYSKLSENKYHCHLNYSYVACWTNDKGTITIEVYYVGSREDAPY